MLSSGELNGVACNISTYLIQDLLKTEMGFPGIVVSDWEDLERIFWYHHCAPDFETAVMRA